MFPELSPKHNDVSSFTSMLKDQAMICPSDQGAGRRMQHALEMPKWGHYMSDRGVLDAGL